MTLDQIFMRLADKKVLKGRATGHGVPVDPQTAVGPMRGRSADGKAIQGRVAGVSRARQLMEEGQRQRAAAKAAKEQEDASKKVILGSKRRRGRGS